MTTSEPSAEPRALLLTGPPDGRSAIAIVQINANNAEITRLLGRMQEHAIDRAANAAPAETAAISVRSVLRDERAVIARPAPGQALIMLHASPAVIDAFMHALIDLGVRLEISNEHRTAPSAAGAASRNSAHTHAITNLALRLYPEAESPMAAAMLLALSLALSPLAISTLLAQPDRWSTQGVRDPRDADAAPDAAPDTAPDTGRERALARLIRPPLIAAIGRANIGKSTLLNTLAGRSVALAYDMPGTTRDHVGATIDLAGLVVRWLDTPGLDDPSAPTPDPVLAIARERALRAAHAADLIVLCAGAGGTFLIPPGLPAAGQQVLRVGLRADQGPPAEPAEVLVSAGAAQPTGIAELLGHIHERLVPGRWLSENQPWRFWRALDATYP
ncbi:MAG: GTPase [Phycisphaerales bacterium]